MSSTYGILLGIVVLAFLFNMLIVTRSSQAQSEVGVAPVVQLVMAVPLFLVSALAFHFTKDLHTHARAGVLLLPLLLQLGFFTFTRELLELFKPGTGGFLIRSYLGAMAASTGVGLLLAWALGALTAR